MKSIYKKIYFHPLILIFALIIILTGNLKNYLLFISIILFHELGHILISIIFRWKINKIIILPFGAITNFENSLNKPIYQELLILIMGPIFQILYYHLTHNPYHYFLLFINLLPIFPLDGSKLLMLFLNKITSYYYSFTIVYTVSIILILRLLLFKNIVNYIMLLYLLTHLIKNILLLKNTIISICFDRYKNRYKFNKHIFIKKFSYKKIRRDRYHFFIVDGKVTGESEIFNKMFDKIR